MGILVVQDVQLGVLIAMMPLLCFQTVSGVGFNRLLESAVILCITILSLLLMCRIVSQFVIDRLFKYDYSDAHTHTHTHTQTQTHTHTCMHVYMHVCLQVSLQPCIIFLTFSGY